MERPFDSMRPSIIDALGNDELHKVVDSMDADLLAPVSGVCRFLQSLVQLVNSWRSVLHAKAHRVPLDLWANREELDAFFAQPIDQVALVLMDTTFTHGVRVFDVLANHLRELALRRGPMLDVALFSCDELYLVVLFARCFIVVDFEGHAIQCVWLPPSLSWTHLCVADGSSHLFVRGVTRRDPPCFVIMAWPSV